MNLVLIIASKEEKNGEKGIQIARGFEIVFGGKLVPEIGMNFPIRP